MMAKTTAATASGNQPPLAILAAHAAKNPKSNVRNTASSAPAFQALQFQRSRATK